MAGVAGNDATITGPDVEAIEDLDEEIQQELHSEDIEHEDGELREAPATHGPVPGREGAARRARQRECSVQQSEPKVCPCTSGPERGALGKMVLKVAMPRIIGLLSQKKLINQSVHGCYADWS